MITSLPNVTDDKSVTYFRTRSQYIYPIYIDQGPTTVDQEPSKSLDSFVYMIFYEQTLNTQLCQGMINKMSCTTLFPTQTTIPQSVNASFLTKLSLQMMALGKHAIGTQYSKL